MRSAETAGRADSAASADSATTAGSAADAALLGGREADSLVRIAGTTDTNPPEGADGDIVSTSITAPTSGYLHIVGSVDSGIGGSSSDGFDCVLDLDDAEIPGSLYSVRVTDPGNDEENCATNTVVEVDAGAHTVDLRGNGVGSAVKFFKANLNVIFAPFGPTGQ